MNTEINLPKNYAPSEFEDRIYAGWCAKGYFTPERDPEKGPLAIVIPPPNVTGQLHMGHALDETLQDILIRYKRMQGYLALWVPGHRPRGNRDPEIKVEENLRKNEGRHAATTSAAEKFLERVWDWKNEYGDRIISQLKKLGSSCDWTRERFTMDEGCSKAVREVFVNLYNKGLIYRGTASSTGARTARPPSRTRRSSTPSRTDISGTSATRSRTAPARSSSRRRVLRRCSEIRRSRSTRTTRDTRTRSARCSESRSSTARSRSSPTSTPTRTTEPAASK